MPLYKYKCLTCYEQFEELVLGNDEKPPCPKCKSEDVTRMVSLISSKGIASGCGDSYSTGSCSSSGFS
ncbi:MAG: zinc ribbon domain-containing protein [Candidatus Zixiibacteriota bacterium]|nr:MAG: zinc ribbon domain-containing protein [candidate division Zixibacteria bacterium]